MKNVTDYAPYAEANQLLHDLEDMLDSLTREYEVVLNDLRAGNVQNHVISEDPVSKAERLLNGEVPLSETSQSLKDLGNRELQLREQIDAIRKHLVSFPGKVERLRDQAHRARRDEMSPEFEKVRKLVAEGAAKLLAAIDAEDALRNELIEGGFGFSEPVISNPGWLDRDLLLLNRGKV